MKNTCQDLAEVRAIADETVRRIATLDRRQFSDAYVREQAAAIRQEAVMKVS